MGREESSMLENFIKVNKADLENQQRQIARLVKERVKEIYSFLPDKRRSAK